VKDSPEKQTPSTRTGVWLTCYQKKQKQKKILEHFRLGMLDLYFSTFYLLNFKGNIYVTIMNKNKQKAMLRIQGDGNHVF
jgi:hypothetical protein